MEAEHWKDGKAKSRERCLRVQNSPRAVNDNEPCHQVGQGSEKAEVVVMPRFVSVCSYKN